MTKRSVRVCFQLDHLKSAVRPLTVASSDVRMTITLEMFDGAGLSLGVLDINVTDRLTLTQRTAVANFLTGAIDSIEAVQF